MTWVFVFLGVVFTVFIVVVVILSRQDPGPRKGKAAVRAGMLALDEFTNPAVEHVVEMEHELEVLAEQDESGEGNGPAETSEARQPDRTQ